MCVVFCETKKVGVDIMASFSSTAKNELSRIELDNSECSLAELSALIRTNGSIHINGVRKISLKFSTENAAIARRIFSLVRSLYDIQTEVMVRRNKQLKKNNNYIIFIDHSNKAEEILIDTGIITIDDEDSYSMNYSISKKLVKTRGCRRAYIRGAFLGGGSVSNPEKTYHLEFVTNSEEHSEQLCEIINSFGLNAKIVLRKDNYIVYLKEGEQIVDLLNIIQAHNALLKLEDIRILKDMRNNVNRIVNCETANLSKIINASIRQITNIKFIDNIIGIDKLPENLIDIANLRLENGDASLKELGEMLSPPVGKSGVNHRLRRLDEIADGLRMKEEKQ